ncbi:MAG: Orn/Lys/Arg decarboxylase N-terminal domain-containing protein [Candidatus Eremiobacteraeota bacterium]|nr:Orn/Lys/Arg decarboxylase N-terminal domain-containing protein [Candidatus Eremiobacteraeota bacterium]
MKWTEDYSILIIDDQLRAPTTEGEILRAIVREIEKMGVTVLQATTIEDGRWHFIAEPGICCILLDWDIGDEGAGSFISFVRGRNGAIPLFIFTEKLTVKDIPLAVISRISGYIWKMEDTADFIAGRIDIAIQEYYDSLLPPFFKGLARYVKECRYSWHTPGHMGGVAFLKSPSGKIFFDFLGENAFRSDLSISVPELGSLLEHTEAVGKAEEHAARVFGADRTFFVTNGNSTSNKIVMHACLTAGDVVLIDRNCHKSVMHGVIMTGAIPLYLMPTRNAYGIIGPIHPGEFAGKAMEKKLKTSPLITKERSVTHTVITNSTYDGICYHADQIKRKLDGLTESLHFDEAWFGYAKFHPLYHGRFGMHDTARSDGSPAVFATQSTHKVLASLSQASMIHVRHGKAPVDFDRFNEAFMMHTSTSPQYLVIASLDVASRMMEDQGGRILIEETLEEAIIFRKKMLLLKDEIAREHGWWFDLWQPSSVKTRGGAVKRLEEIDEKELIRESRYWDAGPGDDWHGFGGMENGYAMLDPIKVTVITPGIDHKGTLAKKGGIPAALVSRFLRSRGIVVEKTGHYSFLILYTIGITKGKSGTLLSKLLEFKRLYDGNAPLSEVFPDLVEAHPDFYRGLGLADLCERMHHHLKEGKITAIMRDVYDSLPPQVMLPVKAYEHLVKGRVEKVPLGDLEGRVSAVMAVPYPPGIPVIMPGEQFGGQARQIIPFLASCEEFDNSFPGFENEVHGVTVEEHMGKKRYLLPCVKR